MRRRMRCGAIPLPTLSITVLLGRMEALEA
jgi:hypothetical protein